MESDFQHRLLALHYVYPKPLSRLNRILEKDPELQFFYRMPIYELAEALNIPSAQAGRIKSAYIHSLQIPFRQIYEKHSIFPISFKHSIYPSSLHDLIDPPVVLYAKGHIDLLAHPSKIAIIGSREASVYSELALSKIIPPLIDQNTVIVSGLAKGADAMAHSKTIKMGGRTIAVVGSGFLHPYPKENAVLQYIIEENHLLVSEYPPYMPPKKWNFPMRNRIISGLSKGIVVTEAKVKSGTLSTIEHALDHGKDIFAVPGNIDSALSEGPHKLIKEGAKPVWNGWQILEEYER
ncbi:DNA-processing protein DprA [Planococcus salinus]|uniref:DNA-protecting protein DprA n=1 Tax=Planococcus salinus TaxID=1848460 RepID=A0A3M8PA76_9BACL|nr:DNA-processing protein DprA [Planococcus salinus]RNF40615.1 DNA-protecting protein DprA [Planococcus salinus]